MTKYDDLTPYTYGGPVFRLLSVPLPRVMLSVGWAVALDGVALLTRKSR